ncbi:MAG: class I SAM-dependent methyltransferase [Candidatus Kerfeldbacteria bacterium]|nr:class I SAM-dependent methyltransferase [Candidatus Kerfeldbacteria bacterium]
MNTQRVQENYIMSRDEKEAFVDVIRRFPWLYTPILQQLEAYIQNGNTLVDIGCGDGYLLQLIHEKFPALKLTGVDVDSFMIDRARRLPFTFINTGVEDFSSTADIIISNLALHHFQQPQTILTKLYSLAKNVLIISDQIRPQTVSELQTRLTKRKEMVGENDVLYYRESEEQSILEAYNKNEIIDLFTTLALQYKIYFYDTDYYERFVAVFEKDNRM